MSVVCFPPDNMDDDTWPQPFIRTPSRFIARYVARRRTQFLGLGLLILAASASSIGVQYAIKVLVDTVTAGHTTTRWLVGIVAVFLALTAGESLCNRLTGWLTCRATVDSGVDLRLDLFHALSGQSMRYFADNMAGALGQRITATAGNFGALVNTIVLRIAPPAVDFLGTIVIFATIDGGMAAVLGGFVVLVTAGLIWFGERGQPIHGAYSGLAAATSGDVVDIIANMWTVKAFTARSREWIRLNGRFQGEAKAQRRSWMYLEKARLIHDVALWIMAATMLTWILVLWQAGRTSPGDVVIVFTLTFRLLHSSKDMALSLVDVAQNIGFVSETLSMVGQPRAVRDIPAARRLACMDATVRFEDVSFGYGPERLVLRHVDLAIPAGQKVGIVGPSGAGKSTLIHILQRLHPVSSGRVLIDGHDIAEVTQESLRNALAVVPQDITLLNRSIMDNIRFARPHATEAEVFAAARAAACDGFIRSLPEGYDTPIGERGVKLSGGQRQRVGIARALLKQAPIILLDEASSALDTESEIHIQYALTEGTLDRTVIAVAHRLSTLAQFDRILVIAQGSIVQDGSLAALLEEDGLFRRMWRLQAEGLHRGAERTAA